MDSGFPFAVILVGQPSVRHRLRLTALDQRIAVGYSIAGMRSADTADYIRHHCKSPDGPTSCSPRPRSD